MERFIMKKFSVIFFAALFTICSIAFAATNFKPMSKSEAQAALSDKTITTIGWATLNKQLIQNSFSGYFGTDGTAVGHFANKPNDNNPQDDQGTWTVKDDGEACATWQHWSNGQEICIYIYDAKNSLIFIGADGT